MNNKSLSSAFLAAVLICGLILVSATRFGTVQASTGDSGIPKPSVPEFTVELVDASYDVPTTYSIDPYTGENVTHGGYHVERTSIEVKIKNHPFTPYYDESSGWNIQFYYNVRMKGHFSEDWIELYRASDGYPHQWSDSDYTVLSYVWGGDADTILGTKMIKLPAGAQVDFQVEAMIGYVHREITIPVPGAGWIFTGETSGWSDTQTVIIGESQTPTPSPAITPTPAPTPAPTPIPVPGQSFFFVESNSTISELFFNSTSSELSFTVTGSSGTAGYVKVTIAKSLLSSVQNVKVYLDGSQLNVAITEDADSWLLSFTYTHSTHHVRISLATNETTTTLLGIDNWIWAGVVIIIVVVGGGFLLYFKKRKH